MPVLPRDPDIDMCARKARWAEHNYCMDHQVSSSNASGCKSDLVSSTVVVDWNKLANVRSSRVRAQAICCRSVLLMFQRKGEVHGQKTSR